LASVPHLPEGPTLASVLHQGPTLARSFIPKNPLCLQPFAFRRTHSAFNPSPKDPLCLQPLITCPKRRLRLAGSCGSKGFTPPCPCPSGVGPCASPHRFQPSLCGAEAPGGVEQPPPGKPVQAFLARLPGRVRAPRGVTSPSTQPFPVVLAQSPPPARTDFRRALALSGYGHGYSPALNPRVRVADLAPVGPGGSHVSPRYFPGSRLAPTPSPLSCPADQGLSPYEVPKLGVLRQGEGGACSRRPGSE
jgi:hypothetical protein